MKKDIARRVVNWQMVNGRHHLPWQNTKDPYRVWLSEIMLQQTQVVTVLGFYEKFLEKFPTVNSLAEASQDQVLALWSGLGYYTRARNLHRCAQAVVSTYGGIFPQSAEKLATLPGIGRSTANAIAAFCFSEKVAILDANVRRVLTRALAFSEDLSYAKNEKLLWQEASRLLPEQDLFNAMPRYTQGLMDLGSAICTPKSPLCSQCPLEAICDAYAEGRPTAYPVKSRRLKRKSESWKIILLRDKSERFWLEKRPSSGIWAGMYCPIVTGAEEDFELILPDVFNDGISECQELPAFVHVLTHRDLHLHPFLISDVVSEKPGNEGGWFDAESLSTVGLPAPVRKLIDSIVKQTALF